MAFALTRAAFGRIWLSESRVTTKIPFSRFQMRSYAQEASTPLNVQQRNPPRRIKNKRLRRLNRPLSNFPSLKNPEDILEAIGKPRRGDFKEILSLLPNQGKEPSDMKELFALDRYAVKGKAPGISTPNRKYFLWCLERLKRGRHPAQFAYDVKPKKKYRGWGPRIQHGKRVRGMPRANDAKLKRDTTS